MRPLFLSRLRCRSRLTALGMAVFSIFGWCQLAWCQGEKAGTADKSAANREFQFTVHYASESGVGAYVPEKWGALRISLMNARSEPREMLCATYFEVDSYMQHCRWVSITALSVLR